MSYFSLLLQMDPQTNLYLQYYASQAGGSLPAFAGARRGQFGSGLGDILRGIFRTIFPVAASGVSTFVNETLRAKNAGGSWGTSLKSALAPTAQNVLSNTLEKLQASSQPQSGGGANRRQRRRRRRSRKRLHAESSSEVSKKLGYKRKNSFGPPQNTEKKHLFKRIKFLNF